MRLEYKNVFYEGSWDDEKDFTFQTDMPIQEIEETFIPGIEPTTITLYDGDQMIVRYYNKGLTSVKITSHSPRIITLSFDLTKISPNAEIRLENEIALIQNNIETLTFWMEQLKQANMFELRQTVNSHQEIIDNWTTTIRDLNEFNTNLIKPDGVLNNLINYTQITDELMGRLTTLEEEVTALEAQINPSEPEPEEPEPEPEVEPTPEPEPESEPEPEPSTDSDLEPENEPTNGEDSEQEGE